MVIPIRKSWKGLKRCVRIEDFIVSSFFDKYGLLHVQPNEPSENGILFLAEHVLLSHRLGVGPELELNEILTAMDLTEWSEGNFQALIPEQGKHFSHDNMTGLQCLEYFYMGMGDFHAKWNDRWWLHPRDLIFYGLLAKHRWAKVLSPLLLLFAYVSVRRERAITSGKCLWFLRFATLESGSGIHNKIGYLGMKMCEKVMKKYHGDKPWADVFQIYFRNPEHPNRRLANEL